MKTQNIKLFFVLPLIALFGCTEEDAYEIPKFKNTIFTEDFSGNTDNEILNIPNWVNYAQQGTRTWTEQVHNGNGYAEFTSFSSGQATNVAWLVSPEIDMDIYEGEKMFFQTAHNFLTNRDNTIELFVTTNYDVTDFNNASWERLNAKFVSPENERFDWVNSGAVDLSKYTGKLRFAFKVTGSGTNTNLDGTFQLDNIYLYN